MLFFIHLLNNRGKVNNQPSTDVIELTLTMKMTTAQVVETSATVNNCPIQDYISLRSPGRSYPTHSLFLDKIFTVLDGTPSEDDHVVFNGGAQMYCMVEQRPVTLEGIYLITPFHTQYFSPDPPDFKAPNATSPKPPPGTQTHGTVRFLCIEKKITQDQKSKMFNYNIIYTVSMTIVTIGDKIVERMFESSNGVFFGNHRNSGPLPTNGGNRIIKLMFVKTRKNERCLTYKRGKNSSDLLNV